MPRIWWHVQHAFHLMMTIVTLFQTFLEHPWSRGTRENHKIFNHVNDVSDWKVTGKATNIKTAACSTCVNQLTYLLDTVHRLVLHTETQSFRTFWPPTASPLWLH